MPDGLDDEWVVRDGSGRVVSRVKGYVVQAGRDAYVAPTMHFGHEHWLATKEQGDTPRMVVAARVARNRARVGAGLRRWSLAWLVLCMATLPVQTDHGWANMLAATLVSGVCGAALAFVVWAFKSMLRGVLWQ